MCYFVVLMGRANWGEKRGVVIKDFLPLYDFGYFYEILPLTLLETDSWNLHTSSKQKGQTHWNGTALFKNGGVAFLVFSIEYFLYFFFISCPQHWRGTEHASSPVPQLQVFSTLNSNPHNSQKNTSPWFISWQIAMNNLLFQLYWVLFKIRRINSSRYIFFFVKVF